MRLGIDGVAHRGEFAKHLARIAVLEQRAVAAAADALDECRNVGIEPDGQAVLQYQGARLVVDRGTAAGSPDERPAGEDPPDHPASRSAERRVGTESGGTAKSRGAAFTEKQ